MNERYITQTCFAEIVENGPFKVDPFYFAVMLSVKLRTDGRCAFDTRAPVQDAHGLRGAVFVRILQHGRGIECDLREHKPVRAS